MSGGRGLTHGAASPLRNKKASSRKMSSELDTPLHNITKHCMWQVSNALAPGILNHTSLVAKVTTFCGELAGAANPKLKKKSGDAPLVQSLDISRFVESAIKPTDFCKLLEEAMLREEDGKLDNAAVQSICYKYYSGEKKGEITFPKWFSSTCTYRLWMVFCVLVEDNSLDVSKDIFTDVLKRLLELSGFNWTDEPENLKSNDIFDFPLFLETITQCFEKFKLESSLTCEVIEDLHDEYVCGVQKKGYLVKKGHVRKNFKKRWFVLQRTTMSYYDSRENMEKKGELILNGNTEVKSIRDEGDKKYRFHVSCGQTGKLFELFAEDHRTKQLWMTAVTKAIALAKVLEQGTETAGVKEFYSIKYGTDDPRLKREDSEIRRIRFLTNRKNKAGATFTEGTTPDPSTPLTITTSKNSSTSDNIELAAEEEDEDDDGEEEYLVMDPLRSEQIITEEDDLELYVPMGEATPVNSSIKVTTPSSPAGHADLLPQPHLSDSNGIELTVEGEAIYLPTDDRGYTYLDPSRIAEIMKAREQECADGDVYEDFVAPSGPIKCTPAIDPGKREVPGHEQPPPPGNDDLYMDARVMSVQLLDGGLGKGAGPSTLAPVGGAEGTYSSWDIVDNPKASGLVTSMTSSSGSSDKIICHPSIRMLSADSMDRDCSSPEDMEQWTVPKDPFKHKTSSLEKKVSHPVADATGSSLPVTEPQEVVSDIEGTGDECDGNYNYVSWDIVNQPIAADHLPSVESPHSYLKITHISGLPSSSELLPSNSQKCTSSPQTAAIPGGTMANSSLVDDIPLSPKAPDNAHLYINLNDVPMATDTPPVPSRSKRASNLFLTSSSNLAPAPPPRITTGASKKPVPHPRHNTVVSQDAINLQ